MNRSLRLAAAVAAASLIAGCALFPNARDRAVRRTPDYQNGYADGCAAANNEGASFRDKTPPDQVQQRATDRIYRAGWNTGFSSCRTMRNPGYGNLQHPIPDPSPGH
ncbi:MAG TPA: hypothetical protein VHW02_06615 [Rhizomicrobium sp.]|nr:hypothetical protein [Rhizomicrobium sp.]